jgi:hypothetical protein
MVKKDQILSGKSEIIPSMFNDLTNIISSGSFTVHG